MEDDKIKDIFKEFNPELFSSFQFMTRLQKNMEAMEIVKQYNAAQKRRNRWAVAIAGLSGFAVGVIMTLLFPFITEWIASFNFSIPLHSANTLNFDLRYLAWLLVGVVSVLTALGIYEIASCRLGSLHSITKQDRHRSEFGMI